MKKVLISFILMVFTLSFPLFTYGQENVSPITVYPVLPENQIGQQTYYHLSVEPGQEQTIYIEVDNVSNDEQHVMLTAVDSFTGPQGGILYEEEMDPSISRLLYPDLALSNFLSIPEEVTIAPGETERIPIELEVPTIESGTMIGAVRILAIGTDEDEGEIDQEDIANVTIRNRISFITAIQLDLPDQPEANFSFGEVGTRTAPTGTELVVEMTNDAQMILRGTTGTYEVEFEGEQLFAGEWDEFTMVPNSQISFPVLWEADELAPGEYTVRLQANVLGKEINEIRTFTIEREQAREHEQQQQQDVITETAIPWWVWVLGAVLLVVVFAVAFLLGRRKT
ncbi:WxL protein peptidoglycan domain-containing protein [Desertibacillus haloalkaliphilus]|uniref:WxL protein peptidoglycan domain-containing protein n=1 Tax=Desertibacillus haloalkaliphilus TaxID=1328930 RepID=UPI001C26052E|nr:DUF916 domain-containing protein [Desertibacillus haloalkaliphilus]MBU8906714.1 DUF916 and DUF3324 domain-containing protein [Desertibacillus haloalkaliphilus]